MAGEVVVDALPYFDQGYDETGVREAALALVEEETRRYRPTKNYLEYLPQAQYHHFETDIMKTEFERLQSRLPIEMMSMKRYELPQPPPGKMTDVSAWSECVENSQAQLEHQALRLLNLELMQEYGTHSWKIYNDILVKMMEAAQKQLSELKKKIQEINLQRKSEQTVAGAKLKDLENSWVGLVSKNYEIERACVEMEKELTEMEKHKKGLRADR
ncbi:pre-mRNA-splicing factor SPF27-like isoform X2 [Dreissena polymorpha]|uniref:pre-mRNA-splicing factor SPF27-like n=1 Tax=Dreissena polymorpha TaxID=45954 RepID=UPI0022648D5D|nr:pre-mRNA-splicing factor SPF27-like [Dreissena polymorpha]XP_052267469.1 pre-mRNA-splicing factor SPF27-like isoform X2 [Dreissena polymorpha]